MTRLFGVDIGREFANAIPAGDQGMPLVTLRRVTYAPRSTSDSTASKVSTETSYTTRGTKEQVTKAGDAAGTVTTRFRREASAASQVIGISR